MDYTIFGSSLGRIRALENKQLKYQKLESLAEAKDFDDALKMLQDTSYGQYVGYDYEIGLDKALSVLYQDMYKTSPVREVVDLLAVKYDGHNIKSLLKAKFSGADPAGLTIDNGIIPLSNLEKMVSEQNFRDLPKTLRSSAEKAISVYEEDKDPQMIDIIVDKGIYAYMIEIAESTGMEYLTEIVKIMIDIINLKMFIRVKIQERNREFFEKVFIPGGQVDRDVFIEGFNDSLEGLPQKVAHTDYYKWIKSSIEEYMKSGDQGIIERYGDNYLIEYIKKSKLKSFGPEAIISYIIAVENEIRALRIILTGKKNNVRPEIIKERLRDTYV